MRKHSENSSKEFMGSSHDSLSKRQAVFSSFKEISLKEGITTDNTDGHKINKSSEMTVASFGDSACTLKLTRLINSGVKPCKGNKRLMRGEVTDIAYLSKESSSCRSADTVNRSNNLHFLDCNGLTEITEDISHFIKLFHEMKEGRDFLRKDEFLRKTIGGDRVFSGLNNLISADRDSSTSATALKCFCNNLSFRGSDKAGRGELFKKKEHCNSEDITDRLQFRESGLKDSFNLVFSRSDKIRDELPFSGDISEVFSVLRDRKLLDGALMSEKESGDSKGVFFIGFGFTQGHLSEIRDQQGINNDRIRDFVRQERKEIDMIAACGLHANQDSRKVFTTRGNSFHQFGKAALIHSGREGKTDIAFRVNACSGERALRNIDTDKQITHNSTSIKRYLSKAGEASRPILHGDKGSMTQSTYYGFGRQGTDSLKGSMTQEIWSSPAFPTLTGKTRLYISYNTNS